MIRGNYGSEPFDLRLTLLRLFRRLNIIVLFTICGSLFFGGLYWLKNVALYDKTEYKAVTIFKIAYFVEPYDMGAYSINETTWESISNTTMFIDAVKKHAGEFEEYKDAYEELKSYSYEDMYPMIVPALPSDIHVLEITTITGSKEVTELIALSLEKTMEEDFMDFFDCLSTVKLINKGIPADVVVRDIRVGRAFVFSAILSFLAVLVVVLIREIADDGIWLPVTMIRRYGIKCLGTMESMELEQNMKYILGSGWEAEGSEAMDAKSVHVCVLDEESDLPAIKEKLDDIAGGVFDFVMVPSPRLCPDIVEVLREASKVVIAIKCGSGKGKSLEYALSYFETNDICIDAALLVDADELLIRTYYRLSCGKKEN